jgi:hypothetical protein
MVRGRIRPKTKNRYKRRIRDVVKGLSRKVAVYKQPVKSECPNCYYEKLTDKSTGVCKWTIAEALANQADWIANGGIGTRYKYFLKGRCPVCRGAGFLETARRGWADCLVTWDPDARGFGNEMTYTPAGTEGSTIVQLKTDPKYYDLFKNCKRIVVDGIDCKLSKPPVLRGLGNQALLIITAFTTDKPQLDSGEIIKDYS